MTDEPWMPPEPLPPEPEWPERDEVVEALHREMRKHENDPERRAKFERALEDRQHQLRQRDDDI